MAIEILDLPIEHGDFPVRYVAVYQRVTMLKKSVGILGFPELLTTIPVGGPGGPLAGPFCANLPASQWVSQKLS